MRQFLFALLYVAVLGLLSNLIAWLLPRQFRPEVFPFRAFGFEKQGKFYEKLGIRHWKTKLPDVSKILAILPAKRVALNAGQMDISLQIQKSCMAEAVHLSLMALSLLILTFWRSLWAVVFILVYNLLGNIPYIFIQRYNRPRLLRLAQKLGGSVC